MRPTTSLAIVVLASAFLTGVTVPHDSSSTKLSQSNESAIDLSRRVHTVGDVWVKIGSDGLIGTPAQGYAAAPDSASEIDASFEFPGGSRREHLYGSGLWIGGLIGGTDTLVMAAMAAGSATNPVFTPTASMRTGYDPVYGHQYFSASYSDSAPHLNALPSERSLGVEISQQSHAFESPPYDRFVIVEYKIRNISRQTIRRVHVGFFADPDVFNELRTNQPESGPADDLTGYLRDRGIAYTFDNDGDVATRNDSTFNDNWCPSGFGLAPVSMDPIPCCTTFNWWATNFGNVEWGPHKSTATAYNAPYTGMPTGSSQMYQEMSNREIDYDQIYAATDKRNEGWSGPPLATGNNVADGLDSRWVLSYGFGDMAPYDSLRLVMAFVAGDSIHTAAGRFPNPLHPDTFLAGLDFTDLSRNVDLARWAWGHDFNLDGAAPPGVELHAVSDHAIKVAWRNAPFQSATGYAVYGRPTGSPEDLQLLARTNADRLEWVDTNLMPGKSYEYSVASIDWNGKIGLKSRPTRVSVGFPIVSPTLKGRNTPTAVGLNWSIPQSDPGFAQFTWIDVLRTTVSPWWGEVDSTAHFRVPILHRQSNARSEPAASPLLPDEFSMQPFDFVDNSVKSAVIYSYRAYLTNSLGNRGPWSPSVEVTPMRPRFSGLVLLLTNAERRSLIDKDYSTSFYTSWADRLGFRVIESDRTTPLLRVMAMYRCIVVVMEDANAEFPSDLAQSDLNTYLANKGSVVFIARNHRQTDASGQPHPLLGKFLGISKTYVETPWEDHNYYEPPQSYVRAGFTHATSHSPIYPNLEGDSAAAWALDYWHESAKGVDSVYGAGFVPAIGAVDSLAPGTDVLYTYVSAYDTSFFHGKPIGVRRITDSSAAILFNFPLSLMKHEQAWQALTQAVADLGIDTINYWPPTQSRTQGIIEWLYGRPIGSPDPAWDINRDGVIDIRDVVELLNR